MERAYEEKTDTRLKPAQGSVVLVDFTYSNQVQSKVRPALVVSNGNAREFERN